MSRNHFLRCRVKKQGDGDRDIHTQFLSRKLFIVTAVVLTKIPLLPLECQDNWTATLSGTSVFLTIGT